MNLKFDCTFYNICTNIKKEDTNVRQKNSQKAIYYQINYRRLITKNETP